MKHVRDFFLSAVERVFARLPSALLMIVLGAFVGPEVVGAYSWMALALTLSQALVDVPLRQISVEAVSSTGGTRLVHRSQLIGIAVSTSVLVLTYVVVVVAFTDLTQGDAWLFFPLIAVPIASIGSVSSIARLQAGNEWASLARIRSFSALLSLACTLPLLISTHSMLWVAIQPLIVESFVFALSAYRVRRSIQSNEPEVLDGDGRMAAELRSLTGYALLGWAEGQLDRVLLGAIAGTTALGSYSYSQALGRSGGEAVANASANVLRAQVAPLRDQPAKILKALDRSALVALSASAVVVVLVWAASEFVLPGFLSPAWAAALAAAPVMALSLLPSTTTWLITVQLVSLRSTRRALPSRLTGLALALPIALLATQSLQLAAWAVVARATLVLLPLAFTVRTWMPWFSITLSSALALLPLATVAILAAVSS